MDNRLQKLFLKISEKNLDAILISQPENRYYLSGFNGSAGYLLITPEKKLLATDFRYIEQASIEAPDYTVFQIKGEISDWFPNLISGIAGQMGFEAGHVTFDLYQRLSDALSKAESKLVLVPTIGVVESIRMIKEPEEIELISKAIEITDRAFGYSESFVRPGVKETEIAWEIEKYMRGHGSEAVAFEAIVAGGKPSAMPHAKPTERKLTDGEPVVMDIGAKYRLYSSDLTRTLCSGRPTPRFKEIYKIVLEAQLTAIEKTRAGMTGNDADAIARETIKRAGYGDTFGHGLGHGLGLAIHEAPRLGVGSRDILQNGMVFSIEPGIYLPEWGGIRIEDTVVMENGRVRPITRAPKLSF